MAANAASDLTAEPMQALSMLNMNLDRHLGAFYFEGGVDSAGYQRRWSSGDGRQRLKPWRP